MGVRDDRNDDETNGLQGAGGTAPPSASDPPGAPDAALAEVDDALERLDRALRALAVDGFDATTLTSAGRRAGSGRATLDRFDAALARRAEAARRGRYGARRHRGARPRRSTSIW
ncbi:MAG: hypothetical protein WKF58_06785 [Ilumatobacteraceae bacterium]